MSRLGNQLPSLVVLVLAGSGLALVRTDDWRPGVSVVAMACLLGAAFRLLLPTRRVGLLAVRSRGADVIALGCVGGAMLVLAAAVPR